MTAKMTDAEVRAELAKIREDFANEWDHDGYLTTMDALRLLAESQAALGEIDNFAETDEPYCKACEKIKTITRKHYKGGK